MARITRSTGQARPCRRRFGDRHLCCLADRLLAIPDTLQASFLRCWRRLRRSASHHEGTLAAFSLHDWQLAPPLLDADQSVARDVSSVWEGYGLGRRLDYLSFDVVMVILRTVDHPFRWRYGTCKFAPSRRHQFARVQSVSKRFELSLGLRVQSQQDKGSILTLTFDNPSYGVGQH